MKLIDITSNGHDASSPTSLTGLDDDDKMGRKK
jgi:hypothetical protein